MDKIEFRTWADNPKYEVSSVGDIYSINYRNSPIKKKLVQNVNRSGYFIVTLWSMGTKKVMKVHIMVAISFLKKIPGKEVVNHINGNKKDNRVDNLEWCTQRENIIHGFAVLGRTIPQHQRDINRLANRAEKNPNNKLTPKQVLEIIQQRKDKVPAKCIAEKYGISYHTVYGIQHNKERWKYIKNKDNV